MPKYLASYAVQRGVGISMHAHVVERPLLRIEIGSFQTASSSGAPIALVQLAFVTSTVLPTGGSLPSAPGLRSPDHATS